MDYFCIIDLAIMKEGTDYRQVVISAYRREGRGEETTHSYDLRTAPSTKSAGNCEPMSFP
jgi:hypothetical protein